MTFGKIVSGLFGIVLLAGLGVGVWWLIKATMAGMTKLNENVLAALITGTAVALASIVAKYLERRHAIAEQFRNDKVKLYNSFMETFDKIAMNEMSEDQLVRTIKTWKRNSLFWSAPKVMNGFMYLGDINSPTDTVNEMEDKLKHIGDFILAMRKDVGLSNRGLAKKRPSGVSKSVALGASYWLKDADKFMNAIAASPSKTLEELDQYDQ